jgi:hypothetical protein
VATANVYIDPKATTWIGWSTVPQLITVAGQGTSLYLGGSVDDYFDLTITNPLGESVTVRLDANSVWGNYEGPQAVILGEAATTPDAYRRSPYFGQPPDVDSFIDEAGAFNTFFALPGSGAGIYNFDFAFGDLNNGWIAGHGDIYLLADVSKVTSAVPEPETWLMLLVGLTGLACRFRRRLS